VLDLAGGTNKKGACSQVYRIAATIRDWLCPQTARIKASFRQSFGAYEPHPFTKSIGPPDDGLKAMTNVKNLMIENNIATSSPQSA
jgi:hypothetical protein